MNGKRNLKPTVMPETFIFIEDCKYPFITTLQQPELSLHEQSPFATLKNDDLHYTFAEYLTLLDIVSTAEASFHFNRFAESFIFPRFTTLDLSNVHDFPPTKPVEDLQIADFRRILNHIGKYVRTAILGQHLPKAPWLRNVFLDSLRLACPQLTELRLEEFNVRGSNFRQILCEFDLSSLTNVQFFNCRGNAITIDNFSKFLNIRHIELTGIRMQCDQMLLLFNNLNSLIISNTFVSKSWLSDALQRNAVTLHRLSLSRLLGFHWKSEVDMWRNLTKLIPNVTDLSLCQSKLLFIESGNFESLEIDQPLCEELINALPRFPQLRKLTANYNSTEWLNQPAEVEIFQKCIINLLNFDKIKELHIVMDNSMVEQGNDIILKLPPTKEGKHHVHVFLYNQLASISRRWLSSKMKSFCQWMQQGSNGSLYICGICHRVDRMRTPLQCENYIDC